MENAYNYLEDRLANLERLFNDEHEAGFYSTLFHGYRRAFEDYKAVRHFLFQDGQIEHYDVECLEARERKIEETINARLNERCAWIAKNLEKSMATPGKEGVYTTSVILANAFNDIFRADEYGKIKGSP